MQVLGAEGSDAFKIKRLPVKLDKIRDERGDFLQSIGGMTMTSLMSSPAIITGQRRTITATAIIPAVLLGRYSSRAT